MKVCRICMSKDDKLYPISSNGLFALYAQLTGVQKQPGDDDASLPQWVCEECGLRLMSYDKLRQKSLRAHHILSQLVQRVNYITEDDLNQIEREYNASESHVDVPLLAVNYPDSGFILKDGDTMESSQTLSKPEGSRNVSQSNDNDPLSNNDIRQEVYSSLDRIILEDCAVFPEPSEGNSENNNNGSQSNVGYTVMEHDIIQEEHEDSLEADTLILEDNLDVCKPSETRLEDALDIQKRNVTNGALKFATIKEFDIDLEARDTPSACETNNDSFLSETLLSDTENDLGLENNIHPDPALCSLEEDNILDLSLLKAKIKNNNLKIKQANSIDLLQTKLPHIKVKKVVVKNKVTEEKVVKQNVAKQKVVKQNVAKQKVVKQNVAKQKVVKENKDSYKIDELITLQILSMEEQIAEFKQRKYSRNYIANPFKCSVCYKGFSTEVTFARHSMMHSDKYGKIECKICKMRFSTNQSFMTHMNSHKNVFTCTECPSKTRFRSLAVKHFLEHKGKVYKCPDCDQEFKTRSSHARHRRMNHVSKFVCKYCGFSFVGDIGLSRHIQMKHQLEKKFQDGPKCETCNVGFVSNEALNTHSRVAHPEKTGEKTLLNQELNYKKDKPIVCELCGVQTAHGKAYSKHFKLFHPSPSTPVKQFVCEQCGKAFKTNYHRTRHSLVHSDPLKLYQCDECGTKCGTKSSLKSHILNLHLPKKSKAKNYLTLRNTASHSGQKRVYPCSLCGNLYRRKHALQRHTMIVHLGQRAFTCDTCGKTFTAKHKMKEHIEHIHMNVTRPTKNNVARRRSSRRVAKKSA